MEQNEGVESSEINGTALAWIFFMLIIMGGTLYLDYMMMFVWWPGINHHTANPEKKLLVLFGLAALLMWNLGQMPIISLILGKMNAAMLKHI
jgi:hypothetical protein